jgi:hypothetical protein
MAPSRGISGWVAGADGGLAVAGAVGAVGLAAGGGARHCFQPTEFFLSSKQLKKSGPPFFTQKERNTSKHVLHKFTDVHLPLNSLTPVDVLYE